MNNPMRSLIVIVGGLMLVGCVSNQSSQSQQTQLPVAQVSESRYDEPTASALAFSPPVLNGGTTVADLSREPREASAFFGYEEQTVNSVYVRTDDRQIGGYGRGGNRGDRYERRAIVEKVGVSYR